MRKYVLLLLPMFLVIGFGQELLQNGDFEDSLDFWTVEQNNNQGSWAANCSTGHHPDPDMEAYVYKYDRYFARIKQTVDIPNTNLQFSASSRLYARHISGTGYYAYAAIILEYVNSHGGLLGRTMIIQKTPNCNLGNTSVLHLIVVSSTNWEDYDFIIADELANLPGVNPAEVAKITVNLESYGTGRSG